MIDNMIFKIIIENNIQNIDTKKIQNSQKLRSQNNLK